MAECVLPKRELEAPIGGFEPLMINKYVARDWAVGTGRAEVIGGDLQPIGEPDTIGETIINIGNSERLGEDFGLVYRIIARAKGAVTLSEKVLERMVEAAEEQALDEPLPF